ncbi:MAG: hypothetical protein CVU91_07450 [Firmicutes bacterium HGW-Firmicutes-16]|nr:MAG: hypothetical protein CVU91_07450 [Firmicutes bacterium HGW-Firmicutes-16]
MKYAKKITPTDKTLSQQLMDDGWKKLKEPSNLCMATLLSIPFAFLLGGITIGIICFLKPALFDFLKANSFGIVFNIDFKIVLYIVVLFVFMIIHELIHAIFIPNFVQSDNTCFGINGLFGFVSTTEPLKKGRFIVISFMPFFILSVIFPIVLNLFQLLNGYMLFLCLLNAMGSCVDFLNIMLIFFQVPNGSIVINNGFETFYSNVK